MSGQVSQFDIVELEQELRHKNDTPADFTIQNLDLNKDILTKINDGGTERTAIQVHGTTGNVSHSRQSAISVGLSADTAIATATYTTVKFNTINTDILSEYNAATGLMTVLNDGLYLVAVKIGWFSVNSGKQYETHIKSNGAMARKSFKEVMASNTSYITQGGAVLLPLSAGNYIYTEVYQNSGGNENIDGIGDSRYSSMHVIKVA